MTMLRALESFPCMAPRLANVEAWLRRILHNTCVDLHRARRFQAASSLKREGADDEAHGQEEAPSPEHLLLRLEREHLLRRQLATLPAPLRQPYAMRFEQGMAYDDIAAELGLTQVNVRRRIGLAYRHLRTALARAWGEMQTK